MIVDWVPAHFPKDGWALGRFDGTALYEHSDPRRGEQLDWGTYVFDFGRPEVRNFLVANALYWLQEYTIDGPAGGRRASMLYLDYSRPARLDAQHLRRPGNLEAVQFLQEMNATVHKAAPGIVTIAEESTSWPGVTADQPWRPWLFDEVEHGVDARHPGLHQSRPDLSQYHHHEMTFSMLYGSARTTCCRSATTRWYTARARLWGRMPGKRPCQGSRAAELLALPVGTSG